MHLVQFIYGPSVGASACTGGVSLGPTSHSYNTTHVFTAVTKVAVRSSCRRQIAIEWRLLPAARYCVPNQYAVPSACRCGRPRATDTCQACALPTALSAAPIMRIATTAFRCATVMLVYTYGNMAASSRAARWTAGLWEALACGARDRGEALGYVC